MDVLVQVAEEDASQRQQHGDDVKTRVIILSGFLGAGKTTLVKHILEQTTGIKVGVIVNDVASVNVDAAEVAKTVKDKESITMIQMQNGCACCSASDDLFKSIKKLMRIDTFTYILVECTGLAEPKRMWANLTATLQEESEEEEEEEGTAKIASNLELSSLVTVVDASEFFNVMYSPQAATSKTSETSPWVENPGPRRFVSELLTEQLESADVVLVNKVDTVPASKLSKVKEMVRNMCPSAALFETEYSKIPIAEIFGAASIVNKTKHAALSIDEEHRAHLKAIKEQRDNSHDACCESGRPCKRAKKDSTGSSSETVPKEKEKEGKATMVQTFVYRRRKAFDPVKFSKVMIEKDSRPGCIQSHVLRSKGYCWLANHSGMTMYWSQAGNHVSLQPIGAWWAEVPQNHWPTDRMPEEIQSDFEGPFGDRRQEIVFIGLGLDEAAISQCLDDCLLSDTEMEELKQNIL